MRYTVKTEVQSFFPSLPVPLAASEVSLPAQEHKFPTVSTCMHRPVHVHTHTDVESCQKPRVAVLQLPKQTGFYMAILL